MRLAATWWGQQDPAETPEGVPYFGFARAMPKASGVGASGFTCFLAEASLLRSFGALLQAYIPCIQPSREPTADSSFSLIPALSAAVGSRPCRTKKRAPIMALIFLVGTTGLEPVTSRM